MSSGCDEAHPDAASPADVAQAHADFLAFAARARALPQAPNEVWQVTCVRLRCWTAAAALASSSSLPPPRDLKEGLASSSSWSSVPVRPWAVLVSCVFPDSGRLLGYDVDPHSPGL